MIKSKIKEVQKQTTYPHFQMHKDKDVIVCVTSETSAVVEWSENRNHKIGETLDCWARSERHNWINIEGEFVTCIKDSLRVTKFLENKKTDPEIKYPCLMKSKLGGNIAIFHNAETATFVYTNPQEFVGKFYKPSIKTIEWELYHGSVTLTQD